MIRPTNAKQSPQVTNRFWYLALLVIIILRTTASASPSSAEPTSANLVVNVTILHDNDLHGHLFPFAYTEIGKSLTEDPSRGGAARRATLIRSLRQSIKNPTFLVDSGDIATRGPLCTTYEGIADVAAMNLIGYNLAAVGNNEFKLKDGVDQTDAAGAQRDLLTVVKRSRFPWICANVTNSDGSFLTGVQPYIIRNFDGVKIGFLGLTAPRSAGYPQTKGLIFSDPIVAANEWIPIVRRHCDILIAVTHIGWQEDEKLAGATTGIDAIIGGDSHTFLYQPLEIKDLSGTTVPIVQDGEFGADLGRFDLTITRDGAGQWHLTGYHDVLLPIGPAIPEATDVRALLAPYVKPFLPVVGHLSLVGAGPKDRLLLTTKIMVDALRQQTGADFAMNRLGAGMFDVFRHRAVTRYDVYAVMPFHDDIMTVKLTGAQISALIVAQPLTIVSGDLKHLNGTMTYQTAFVDYEALSAYGIPATDEKETGIDVRSAIIQHFGQMNLTRLPPRSSVSPRSPEQENQMSDAAKAANTLKRLRVTN